MTKDRNYTLPETGFVRFRQILAVITHLSLELVGGSQGREIPESAQARATNDCLEGRRHSLPD